VKVRQTRTAVAVSDLASLTHGETFRVHVWSKDANVTIWVPEGFQSFECARTVVEGDWETLARGKDESA
jgi:hypothetical protein